MFLDNLFSVSRVATISEQMKAAAFLREVAVHLFDEAALTEDDNPVARLQLRVTIDEGALVFTSYKAT